MSFLTRRLAEVFRSSKRILILAALAVFACAMFAAHGLAQQEQERLLEKQIERKEPVRLKAIEGKKGIINISEKFLDDDEWLKSLSFSLENISEKNITFIELELEFPRSDSVPPLVFGLGHGLRPMVEGSVPVDPSSSVKPGEEVVLKFSDEEYDALQKHLGDLKYTGGVKHVILDIRTVLFDDGLMWSGGRLLRPDPDDPRRWVPIDRSFTVH